MVRPTVPSHRCDPLLTLPYPQGCAKVLVDGTTDGICKHIKALFERGERVVVELREILAQLGHAPDEFLPIVR